MKNLHYSDFKALVALFRKATTEIGYPRFAGNILMTSAWLKGLEQKGLALYALTETVWDSYTDSGYETTNWNSVERITVAWQLVGEVNFFYYDGEYDISSSFFVGPNDLM